MAGRGDARPWRPGWRGVILLGRRGFGRLEYENEQEGFLEESRHERGEGGACGIDNRSCGSRACRPSLPRRHLGCTDPDLCHASLSLPS